MRREYPEAPIVGVGAVIVDGSKVLLVRRGNQPLKGEWSLPGGALELGETIEQGVVREVFEETGLLVQPAGLVELVDRIVHDDQSGRVCYHYVLIDFVCRVTGGSELAGSDADEIRWVERVELGQYGVAPVTLRVIEKAFESSQVKSA